MADWTELLPEGVETPVVIEVRYPEELMAKQPPGLLDRIRKEIASLLDDPEYSKLATELQNGIGEYVSVLGVPVKEQWVMSEEGGEGDKTEGEEVSGSGVRRGKRRLLRAGRRPGPEARDVSIIVHLPPSVALTPEDEEDATETIMDWFESSKLGQIFLREFRAGGVAHAGAAGRRYAKQADIRGIRSREEAGPSIHPRQIPRLRRTGR